MLFDGDVRRLNRSLRAVYHLDYCLHSLRLPWSSNSTTFLHQRKIGQLYSANDFRSAICYLEGLLDDPDIDGDQHYRASLVLDTLVPFQFIPLSSLLQNQQPGPIDPISEETLEDHQGILHEVIFSVEPPLAIFPRRHIMWKLLPRAGMPRRFAPILDGYMQKDTTFKREFAEMIACSLLGNYRHCPKHSRADLWMRSVIYDVCMPATVNAGVGSTVRSVLYDMIVDGGIGLLMLFALREYLIYLIEEDPNMLSHARALFDFDAFKTTVVDTMATVRLLMRKNLKPGGKMTEETIGTSDWKIEMEEILSAAYATVVTAAYRKPRPYPLHLLKSTKGKLPPSKEWLMPKKKQIEDGVIVSYCSGPTADEKCSITRERTRTEKRKRTDGGGGDAEDDTEETKDDIAINNLLLPGIGDDDGVEQRLERRYRARKKRPGLRQASKKKKEEKDNDDNADVVEPDRIDDIMSRIAMNPNGKTDGASLYRLAELLVNNDDDDNEDEIVASGVVSGEKKQSIVLTRDCVKVEHCRMLREWVSTIDPDTDPLEAYDLVMGHLPIFGAPQDALTRHRELASLMYAGNFTKSNWLEQLTHLRGLYPYTYNLIQTGASLWCRHIRVRRYPLPYHYPCYQTMALSDRYHRPRESPETLPTAIPDQPCRFAFCCVCRRIYSIVRKRPSIPKKESSRPKPLVTHGYVDVHVDLGTGEIYCNKGHFYQDQKCGQEPLTEIAIIGEELQYGGTNSATYMICAQPGCGQIAMMHPENTTFTERGLACFSCTIKIRTKPIDLPPAISGIRAAITARRVVHSMNKGLAVHKRRELPPSARCFLCERDIVSESNLFLFGYDTFVCKRHITMRLLEHVRMGLLNNGMALTMGADEETQDIVRDLILEYVMANKESTRMKRVQISAAMAARVRRATETARIHR